MTWTFTDSLTEFRAAAADFLAAHPAENTVLLTLVDRLAGGSPAGGDPSSPPRFGWWRPGAGSLVAGALIQTPPHPLRLGRMPLEAATELLDALPDGPELTGVGGAVRETRAFAAAWAERSGGTVTVHEEQRLYRLGELALPVMDGRLRQAVPADQELLVAWFQAFFAAVNVSFPGVEDLVARRAADGDLHLWEVEGRPVALAGLSPVLAGMTRIGPVYTPPELRGHGYAGAATAAVSALGRERGARQVLLYTDLANSTSNSIYQKLGYRPVEDSVILGFTPSPS
ncbi:GNAT family N-acetyltransferase [Kitasatospora sp. NBC_01287]|uniref:GNAT family N-acetyltransferase n=1 Tax=Kitasatospora sp. NBC_01287 TaxID=2903573 RepID=UPI00225C1D12|nr:GNAT family N-acetyltransferase [Kitasatospora sp. NBC_01287]MCX4747040.1 GNAT family N-acetyltransferase [Kitasatospora sp. NBC_01287]